MVAAAAAVSRASAGLSSAPVPAGPLPRGSASPATTAAWTARPASCAPPRGCTLQL